MDLQNIPWRELLLVFGGCAAVSLVGAIALLIVAAVLGDTVNYWIGHLFGPKMAAKSTKTLGHGAGALAGEAAQGGLQRLIFRHHDGGQTESPLLALPGSLRAAGGRLAQVASAAVRRWIGGKRLSNGCIIARTGVRVKEWVG